MAGGVCPHEILLRQQAHNSKEADEPPAISKAVRPAVGPYRAAGLESLSL